MSSQLIEELEKATDDEIVTASKKLTRIFTNKILIGIVVSVVVHFASDAIITAIDSRKKDPEETV